MSDPIPRSWFRRLTPTAPSIVTGLSINDDFTDRKSDVADLMHATQAAFAGTQESKRDNLRARLMQRHGWRYGVRQELATDATSGVSVVWDRLACKRVGKATNDPEEVGGGWIALTGPIPGMLSRGVVWQDVDVRVGWRRIERVRVASCHRPPQRFRNLWAEFDGKLAQWEEDSPLPVVIFMDSNEPGGPDVLVRLTGLRWHGVGIDGALTDLGVPDEAVALERRHSDHKAVAIPFRL